MAATLALENGDALDGAAGLGEPLKLGDKEEEDEEEEEGLLSTSSHIPKLQLISLNQSFKNLIRKSTLTF